MNSRESRARAAAVGISGTDIERERDKILNSPVFAGGQGHRKKPGLGPLLLYLVTEMLAGRPLDDRRVVEDFYHEDYGEWPDTNTKARGNLKNLRFALEEYYAVYGAPDRCWIDIPLNQFTPEAKINPRSPASQDVRMGLYQTHRESPASIELALKHFDNAIASEALYAEAYAGKAGALIVQALHTFTEPAARLLQSAHEAASKAIELDKNSWRGHLNLANVHLFRHKWELADRGMAKAEELVGQQILEIGACGPYLIARGRYQDALKLAETYRAEYVDDVLYVNRSALYFYGLRKFDLARSQTQRIIREMDPHFWQAHLIETLSALAQEDNETALFHMSQIERLANAEVWPGLMILCLAVNGRTEEAQSKLNLLTTMEKGRYVQPLQLAIGHMALDDHLRAITLIEKACEEFDPFTAWLHAYSVLDVLRGYPQFQRILRELRFPRFDLS